MLLPQQHEDTAYSLINKTLLPQQLKLLLKQLETQAIGAELCCQHHQVAVTAVLSCCHYSLKLVEKPLELLSQKHYIAATIEPAATTALECCHDSLKVHSHHLILLLPQKSNVLELPPLPHCVTLVI
jgi:hypothetical protein